MMRAAILTVTAIGLAGCVEVSFKDKSDSACFEMYIPKDEAIRAIKFNKCTGETWGLIRVSMQTDDAKWTYRWSPLSNNLYEPLMSN